MEQPSPRRRGPLVPLVLLLAVALLVGWVVYDRNRVTQDELTDAATVAARSLDGSFGPVNPSDVRLYVARELDRDVLDLDLERSELDAPDETTASYTIEVRLADEESGPVACLDVLIEIYAPNAPDLRFTDVEASEGACG